MAIVIVLTLTTLACAFIGTGWWLASNRVAIHTRLPTLTRTPLPSLTPTVISSSQVVPMSAELAVAPTPLAPTPTPVLIPTFTSASSDLAAVEGSSDGSSILTSLVGLNVRTGPGVDYPIVGKLAQGQSAPIIGKNPEGTWWQIVYSPGSGGLAWVSANTQYSTVSTTGEVQIAQLPPPPPPMATPISAPAVQPEAPAIQPIQTSPPPGAPTTEPSQTTVPSSNPTTLPIATSIPGPPGWAFTGVRLYTDQDVGGLILYGNMINNTGSPQELISVTGAFFDAQGQMIADAGNTYAYWPGYVIPPGGRMPFELFVDDVDNAARFDLSVEAEASDETPRQDFQFAEVNQWTEDGTYCVGGKVRRPDENLDEYLVIAAVLYDGQDNIVNFSDYGEFGEGVGENEPTFEICIDPPNQEVTRYEVQAWGQ